MKFEPDPNYTDELYLMTDKMLEEQLAPPIVADAKRYCPKETGDLEDSVEAHLNDHDLIVSASGSKERDYATYVELGHRIYHPGTGEVGPDKVRPHPFLRPAVYKERSGEVEAE